MREFAEQVLSYLARHAVQYADVRVVDTRGPSRHLINFVMSSEGLQEDCFDSLVLDKPKNDSEVVTSAAGPETLQLTF